MAVQVPPEAPWQGRERECRTRLAVIGNGQDHLRPAGNGRGLVPQSASAPMQVLRVGDEGARDQLLDEAVGDVVVDLLGLTAFPIAEGQEPGQSVLRPLVWQEAPQPLPCRRGGRASRRFGGCDGLDCGRQVGAQVLPRLELEPVRGGQDAVQPRAELGKRGRQLLGGRIEHDGDATDGRGEITPAIVGKVCTGLQNPDNVGERGGGGQGRGHREPTGLDGDGLGWPGMDSLAHSGGLWQGRWNCIRPAYSRRPHNPLPPMDNAGHHWT